jgi:hypothetical protein
MQIQAGGGKQHMGTKAKLQINKVCQRTYSKTHRWNKLRKILGWEGQMDCTMAHCKDCTGLSLHAQVVAVGMHWSMQLWW